MRGRRRTVQDRAIRNAANLSSCYIPGSPAAGAGLDGRDWRGALSSSRRGEPVSATSSPRPLGRSDRICQGMGSAPAASIASASPATIPHALPGARVPIPLDAHPRGCRAGARPSGALPGEAPDCAPGEVPPYGRGSQRNRQQRGGGPWSLLRPEARRPWAKRRESGEGAAGATMIGTGLAASSTAIRSRRAGHRAPSAPPGPELRLSLVGARFAGCFTGTPEELNSTPERAESALKNHRAAGRI